MGRKRGKEWENGVRKGKRKGIWESGGGDRGK